MGAGQAQPPPRGSGKPEVGETWPLAISQTQPGLPGIPALDTVPSSHCQCAGYKTIPREAAFKGFAQSFQKPLGGGGGKVLNLFNPGIQSPENLSQGTNLFF